MEVIKPDTSKVYVLIKQCEGYANVKVEQIIAISFDEAKLKKYVKQLPKFTEKEQHTNAQYIINSNVVKII
jgi:ribosomal 50S subunit-recycling heat shock protein